MQAAEQIGAEVMQIRAGEKYAMIAGVLYTLPDNAKYVLQCHRGCWFWANRKPRIKLGEWTLLKEPIQIKTNKGFDRVLRTPQQGNWKDSIQRVSCDNYIAQVA